MSLYSQIGLALVVLMIGGALRGMYMHRWLNQLSIDNDADRQVIRSRCEALERRRWPVESVLELVIAFLLWWLIRTALALPSFLFDLMVLAACFTIGEWVVSWFRIRRLRTEILPRVLAESGRCRVCGYLLEDARPCSECGRVPEPAGQSV